MDTQWPRYYVFERPRAGAQFIHAGSVHAADRDMALLTARNVFARRPSRNAMWVVRSDLIFSRTIEELALETAPEPVAGDTRSFQIFAKTRQNGVCIHQGAVAAADHGNALAAALEAFQDVKALVWWVIADEDLVKSDDAEAPILFESSPGKHFRHEKHYPVRTMMREVMLKAQKKETE